MSATSSRPRLKLCYSDTGGTFTDCLIVDEAGNFVLGKAPTTPHDLSIGYFNAVAVAAEQVGASLEQAFAELEVVGYGATTGINTLLTRTGAKVGLMVTRGFEKILQMERGVQPWLGLPMSELIQGRTHRHTEPLVPLSLIRGVTERVDCLGKPAIPLYEDEVRRATRELLEQNVEAIAVCFLFSWLNSEHERRAGDIAREIISEQGRLTKVYLRSDVCPRLRELPSFNTTIIEAYVGPACRRGLLTIEEKVKAFGFKGALGIMLSTGGLSTIGEMRAVETMSSGPAGGVVGAKYIGELYGFDNIISTDVGGTSFDVAVITRGMVNLNREASVGQCLLGVPMLEVQSIGAGGGTLARLDPLTGRLTVGPQSAGSVPGPVCYGQGGETPTVTDADVVLGYVDPDYFLGGKIKLHKDKAEQVIRKKIAEPLGLSVENAAMGVRKIIDARMRDTILGMAVAAGLNVEEYHILAFGGAGPTHAAGYTEGIPCKGVLSFPYSAVFCAFGASAADYERRMYRSSNIIAPPGLSDMGKMELGSRLNGLWEDLEQAALENMERQGFSRENVELINQAMVRYGRQLDDLVVNSPVRRIREAQDWNRLIAEFELWYEKTYARAAKYPQAGYEILEIGLVARARKVKPKVPRHGPGGRVPPSEASRPDRVCYFPQGWLETKVLFGPALRPGNHLSGPAVIEYPSTSLLLPPERRAEVDEYLTVWMR